MVTFEVQLKDDFNCCGIQGAKMRRQMLNIHTNKFGKYFSLILSKTRIKKWFQC